MQKIFFDFFQIMLAFFDKLWYSINCKEDFTFRNFFLQKLYPLLIIYTPLIGKTSGYPHWSFLVLFFRKPLSR